MATIPVADKPFICLFGAGHQTSFGLLQVETMQG